MDVHAYTMWSSNGVSLTCDILVDFAAHEIQVGRKIDHNMLQDGGRTQVRVNIETRVCSVQIIFTMFDFLLTDR